MGFDFHFLSLFREILIPHHRSLEFRAKIFAAMICAKNKVSDVDFDDIKEIATEIYPRDNRRINALTQTAREITQKIKTLSTLTLDDLLKDIDAQLREIHRYAKKIDFSHLRRLMLKSDENDALIQQRVYEFFLSEVKRYS